MISIGIEVEYTSTHEASEIVREGVARHRSVEHILQRTAGMYQKESYNSER